MAQFVHCSPLVQATNTGPVLLKRIIKLHCNWSYPFLRPSVLEVVKRYGEKWPYSGANTAMAATPPPSPRLVQGRVRARGRSEGWVLGRGGGGRGGQSEVRFGQW